VEEYTRARHTAFAGSSAYMLEKIRNGKVKYMKELVNDIADNEYFPAEICLSEDEFKEYTGILALAIVKKTVRNLHHL
jgi:hypothetical protein